MEASSSLQATNHAHRVDAVLGKEPLRRHARGRPRERGAAHRERALEQRGRRLTERQGPARRLVDRQDSQYNVLHPGRPEIILH